MARTKPEIEIGFRAAEEFRRLQMSQNVSLKKICTQTGIKKNRFYAWSEGQAPGARALQALHYAGADVIYILTGRKCK